MIENTEHLQPISPMYGLVKQWKADYERMKVRAEAAESALAQQAEAWQGHYDGAVQQRNEALQEIARLKEQLGKA